MSFGKVIHLSIPNGRGDVAVDGGRQFELFAGRPDYDAVAFLDPSFFDQDKFLSILTRQQFHMIFDLRPKPIFRKPAYDHKAIMSYMYDRCIFYYDIGRLAQEIRGDFDDMVGTLTGILSKNSPQKFRFTLCLVDRAADEAGVVASFRQHLAIAGSTVVELNPRSII